MKFTILGFQQQLAITLKLDLKDLMLLRWMLDFYNTGTMEFHVFDGQQYFWVNYKYLIQQLPILGISSKDVLKRRLRNLIKAQVMDFKIFEGAGNKTYYRFNTDVLLALLSGPPDVNCVKPVDKDCQSVDNSTKNGIVPDRVGGGSDPKVGRVPTQKSEGFRPKSRTHVDSSINDSSISDRETARASNSNCINNPSLDEVKSYCLEKGYKIDPKRFFTKMEAVGWKQGSTQVVNWRALVDSWSCNQFSMQDSYRNVLRKQPDPGCSDCGGFGRRYSPGSGKVCDCHCTAVKEAKTK